MKIPENLPKGYSWIDFTEVDMNRPVDELIEYANRSELKTSAEMILTRLLAYKDQHPELMTTPAGICVQYIIDHPELYSMLKEVNDGSYRTNRLLLLNHSTLFDNYEHQRFLESLHNEGPVNFSRDPRTKEEVIDLFEECIQKDGVIFIHFDYPTNMNDDSES